MKHDLNYKYKISRDIEILFKKMYANMDTLVTQIAWMRDNGSDYEKLIDEAYVLTKDSFKIILQCRALKGKLEDDT
jgi:hypothetical protein